MRGRQSNQCDKPIMNRTNITNKETPSRRSLVALDWVNFFVGDVLGGLGPYLAAFLRTTRHWDAGSIGTALSAMSIATILFQAPAGALIDKVRKKRQLICAAVLAMSVSAIALTFFEQLQMVVAAQVLYGLAAAVAGPCIVAVSLGLVGHKRFASRIARNEALNHVGNVTAAVLGGMVGYFLSSVWIFYLVAAFGLGSVIATCFIKEGEIDHNLARGARDDEEPGQSVSIAVLLQNKHIIAFAIAVFLFHLSNAAMLPLAGQYLSEGRPKEAAAWISACIVAAQLVMIPVSIFAGKFSQQFGRKPVFLAALAVLPIRGFMYTLSNSPYLVLPVQLLDGIGAGIFGVLASVIVADLTKGTGHYNVTRGLIITAQGIGAALSNLVAGWIVFKMGYNVGFLSLAGIGLAGLITCYLGLPETGDLLPQSNNAHNIHDIAFEDETVETLRL